MAVIPRRFHLLWVGPPMPDHLREYGKTWERHHPDWEFYFWNEANMPPLRNQRIYDDAERIAPRNVGQLRADIARYEILYDLGGVWVDRDQECLKPIDPLCDVDCFAGWEKPNRWAAIGVLGTVPGHPFYADLIEGLAANVRRKAGARPNALTGPRYFTSVYRRHAKAVTVYPKETFYSYGWEDVGTERDGRVHPDAQSVHHWNNARTNHWRKAATHA